MQIERGATACRSMQSWSPASNYGLASTASSESRRWLWLTPRRSGPCCPWPSPGPQITSHCRGACSFSWRRRSLWASGPSRTTTSRCDCLAMGGHGQVTTWWSTMMRTSWWWISPRPCTMLIPHCGIAWSLVVAHWCGISGMTSWQEPRWPRTCGGAGLRLPPWPRRCVRAIWNGAPLLCSLCWSRRSRRAPSARLRVHLWTAEPGPLKEMGSAQWARSREANVCVSPGTTGVDAKTRTARRCMCATSGWTVARRACTRSTHVWSTLTRNRANAP